MNDGTDWKAIDSITAGDVMTAAPRTCSTFSTVLEAVMIFRDNDCGAVPILEEGKPVAILTDRDVALAISEFPDLANQPVSAIITPGIVSVAAADRLRACVRSAAIAGRPANAGRRFGRDVVGIIGWADIAPVLSDRMMGQVVRDAVAPPESDRSGWVVNSQRHGPSKTARTGVVRSGPSRRPTAAQAQHGVHPVEVAIEFLRRQREPQPLAAEPDGGGHGAEHRDGDRGGTDREESETAPPRELGNQKLGDARKQHGHGGKRDQRTRDQHGAGGLHSLDILPELDGGHPGLQLGQVEQVFAEPGDAAHDLAGGGLGSHRAHRAKIARRLHQTAWSVGTHQRRLISHPITTPAASAAPRVNPGRVLTQVLTSLFDVAKSLLCFLTGLAQPLARFFCKIDRGRAN